jgi:hypothetical protein
MLLTVGPVARENLLVQLDAQAGPRGMLATPSCSSTVLLAILTEANAACDTISAAAWQAREFRRLPLQKLIYHDIKASFRLGAQILVRCIAKVADAYKLDKKTLRTFRPEADVHQLQGTPGWRVTLAGRSGLYQPAL